jgi:hypothetical protein
MNPFRHQWYQQNSFLSNVFRFSPLSPVSSDGHGLTQECVQNHWGWAGTEGPFGPVHTDLVSIQSQSDTGLDAPEMWMDVPPHQPSLSGADGEESSQRCLNSQWGSHRTEGHGCACVHVPSEPGRCCHSCAGSPLFNFRSKCMCLFM